MVSIAQAAIRLWTFIWTLLALALLGNVIADAFSGNSSSINYAMFTAVISMVVVLYGFAAAFVEALAMPLALIVMDGIAMLFSFIAGVVLAAKLGAHSCSNNSYTLHNNLTNGSHNRHKRCTELQASTAFFWFMFAGFAASMVLSALSSRGSGLSSRGGIRKGPSMSQV